MVPLPLFGQILGSLDAFLVHVVRRLGRRLHFPPLLPDMLLQVHLEDLVLV